MFAIENDTRRKSCERIRRLDRILNAVRFLERRVFIGVIDGRLLAAQLFEQPFPRAGHQVAHVVFPHEGAFALGPVVPAIFRSRAAATQSLELRVQIG